MARTRSKLRLTNENASSTLTNEDISVDQSVRRGTYWDLKNYFTSNPENFTILKYAIGLLLIIWIIHGNASFKGTDYCMDQLNGQIKDLKMEIEKLKEHYYTLTTKSVGQVITTDVQSTGFWSLFTSNKLSDVDYVKMLIKQALYVYNADKTGLSDYALESSGGNVLIKHCSTSYLKYQTKITILGFVRLPYIYNTPRLTIQANMQPGECWSFEGTKGVLVIKLSYPIRPTVLSIEHIPSVLSPNGKIDSAPKDFSVNGYTNTYERVNGIALGNFTFDATSIDYLQYFPIRLKLNSTISIIEFRFESNHGNPNYTCVYRVRVHGTL